MIRKYVIPILAVIGVGLGAWQAVKGAKTVPPTPPVVEPPRAPFTTYISGAGLVEASTENIAIGTNFAGIATHVHVKVGRRVKAGDPLFTIDDRTLQADLQVRQTALRVAREQLAKLKAQPRPEEIPPAEARVTQLRSSLADAKNQLEMWEAVPDKRAVSEEEVLRRRFAVQVAEARLAEAEAALAELKAGAWSPDIAIAEAQVESAAAQVNAVQTEIERATVRASIDGTALRVNVRPGEFAPAGQMAEPLILLGNIDVLHVRVDLDENDAWRFSPQARAEAYVRGNRELRTELRFVRLEPFVVPKRSLTGESTERVDTRVLQVIYAFDREKLPVYAGQQMDVYIDSPPIVPLEQKS